MTPSGAPRPAPSVAWIAVGSNLDAPATHVTQALRQLAAEPGLRLLAASQCYRTEPVGGPPGQAQFCNACAAVATDQSPFELLDRLLGIEAAHGRIRTNAWGPRTLDLDIVAFDARRLHTPHLKLPHPRASERGFVLVPLVEIAPALDLGAGERAIECLARVSTADVVPWSDGVAC